MKNETELEYPEAVAQTDSVEQKEAVVQTDAVEQKTESTAGNDMTAEMSWSPGALIKRAREARKLSLEALSLQTKLSVRVLRALEIDDFDALSEPVFVRGYYRSCAHVLGISSGEVTNAYERASGEPPPSPLPLKPAVGEEDLRPPPRWLPYLVFAIVAGGLVALIMWWGQPVTRRLLDTPETTGQNNALPSSGGGLANSPASEAGGQFVTAAATKLVAAPASGGTVEAAAAPAVSQSLTDASPRISDTASSPATDVASTGTASAPAAAETSILKVDFTQKSWVRITDATGERLLNGLVPGGSHRELAGEAPFDVLLGYAPGVDLSYDGKTVALNDYIQSNNTAHLTIGGP